MSVIAYVNVTETSGKLLGSIALVNDTSEPVADLPSAHWNVPRAIGREIRRVMQEKLDLSECQDCGLLWPTEDLNPVRNLLQRVEPGEPMPSGDCPKCGAVCHLAPRPTRVANRESSSS